MGRQNNRRKKGTARKASSKRYHKSGLGQGNKQIINTLMSDETVMDVLAEDQVSVEEALLPQPEEPTVPVIIVIPGEGTSPGMTQAYVDKLQQYCNEHGADMKFLVFSHDATSLDIVTGTERAIWRMVDEYDFTEAEVHAHGGLGAYVAYRMLCIAPKRIKRVFFIGGASSEALTNKAKSFYQKAIKIWYWSYQHGLAKFYASIKKSHDTSGIMNSDSEFMQKYPELYLNQVLFVGSWVLDPLWRAEDGKAYFIPNGNAYDYGGAVSTWYQHNVSIAQVSGSRPSPDTKMTVEELFATMEQCKLSEKETGY